MHAYCSLHHLHSDCALILSIIYEYMNMGMKHTTYEKNYHSTKLKFLALKWAITEQFKEYLPYQPFVVQTDYNPLTYIMMTPNLDAMGHRWVGALVRFNFQLEYQKGQDNTMADASSQITPCLEPTAVKLDSYPLG